MEDSKIEWCHHTLNPWRGCTKVSAGCANCYAETMSGRNPAVLGVWGPNGTRVVAAEAQWRLPLKWDREAREAGERRRVFCASLADVFEGPETMPAACVQAVNEARARLFALIQDTPNLDWLLLTKRPENFAATLRAALDTGKLRINGTKRGLKHWNVVDWLHGNCPPNVWLGTSVEDQAAADARIPHLLCIPAAVRFLSCEPLLSDVQLHLFGTLPESETPGEYVQVRQRLHWVIAGGESGPGARPMHPDWARSLRDQCQAAEVPFFFKQWGEYLHAHPSELHLSPGPLADFQGLKLQRVGKKAAGRLLDGREWSEYPR